MPDAEGDIISNTYVFEVVPRSAGKSASKSLQYWSTGNGDDTMVTIWNPADEAQDFAYTLFFSGGHYVLPIHLEPRATRSFNVSEIIQSQVPDAEGNIIPAAIHEGGAKIAGSIAENQHILVALDSGTYNVRKATCSTNCQECDGYSSASLVDSPFAVAVAGTHQENFTLTYGSGTQYNFNSNGTWSSSNTSMATVTTGLVKGVSPGSPKVTVLVDNVPVQAGYICTGPSNCPESNFTQSSQGDVFQVTGVVPSPFVQGTSGAMGVGGSGFQSVSGSVSIQFDGTGISATNVMVQDDQNISAQFSVAASAPTGQQNLKVVFTGSDGGTVVSNPFPVTVTATAPVPAKAAILSQPKQTYTNQTWMSCDGAESQANMYGYQRCVTYQIEDSNSNAIFENFTVNESVSVVDPGNVTANLHTGNSSSNPAGQFLDGLVLLGKPVPRSPAMRAKLSNKLSQQVEIRIRYG